MYHFQSITSPQFSDTIYPLADPVRWMTACWLLVLESCFSTNFSACVGRLIEGILSVLVEHWNRKWLSLVEWCPGGFVLYHSFVPHSGCLAGFIIGQERCVWRQFEGTKLVINHICNSAGSSHIGEYVHWLCDEKAKTAEQGRNNPAWAGCLVSLQRYSYPIWNEQEGCFGLWNDQDLPVLKVLFVQVFIKLLVK